MKDDDKMRLLTTRVSDGASPVPGNVTTHTCSECGERVNVSPASQAALAADPEIEIVCMYCFVPQPGDTACVSPASLAEFARWKREKDSH